MSPPIMKQCHWNFAGMLHPMKYTRWYIFWCCYGNMLGSCLPVSSVPVSSKLNITICDSTRQNFWSCLRSMPVPPSLGLLLNIFNCIFYPVQLEMVIFDFKEDGTGTKHVVIATSKCVPSGIFHRVQHPCQVSIALLDFVSWSHHCTCTTDYVISD